MLILASKNFFEFDKSLSTGWMNLTMHRGKIFSGKITYWSYFKFWTFFSTANNLGVKELLITFQRWLRILSPRAFIWATSQYAQKFVHWSKRPSKVTRKWRPHLSNSPNSLNPPKPPNLPISTNSSNSPQPTQLNPTYPTHINHLDSLSDPRYVLMTFETIVQSDENSVIVFRSVQIWSKLKTTWISHQHIYTNKS